MILYCLGKRFECCRQTFYLLNETFAKKSVLSANKSLTLQQVNALYVRVETFAKQSIIKELYLHKHLALTIFCSKCIRVL